MAKCRSCGADIPDGSEYCAECLSKLNTAKDSESYLDSLLSAVMTEEPERREIVFPKRETSSLVSVPEDKKPVASEENPPVEVPEQETAPMEDALGVFFDAETELPDIKSYNIFENVDDHSVERLLAADLGFWDSEEEDDFEEEYEALMRADEGSVEEDDSEENEEELLQDAPDSEVGDIEELFGMLEDERGADAPEEIEMATPEVISAADLDAAADTFSGIVEASEEEEPVSEFGDFADLFGGLTDGEEEAPAEDAKEAVEEEVPIPEFGDFADLFGSGDVVQDETPVQSAEQKDASMSDFADLFGDSDEDFSGLFEFGAEPEELDVPEEKEEEDVLAAMAATTMSQTVSQSEESPAKDGKKKKGSGRLAALYHKLFDNVKVDPSKIKQPPSKEEIEAKKREKEEAKAKAKEEKEALLAEKKEQEKQVKLEKQRVAKEAKAEKKAKKMEEAKLMLEEMEKTRINRAGASIVFIFFAMIAVVIIVGTSIFSYSLSIKNAEHEFNNDQYTAAYNEIYGLDVKGEEDILLYDRIMTVMYVQKQLNSYDNYYRMNDKPKALDSLLKGLQRYEKYIDLAVDLEVDTDLDSVRKKILEKINDSFSMSEQEAMEIIQSDSQAEYSKKVYDAVEGLE